MAGSKRKYKGMMRESHGQYAEARPMEERVKKQEHLGMGGNADKDKDNNNNNKDVLLFTADFSD
jgi:hypothetical protein